MNRVSLVRHVQPGGPNFLDIELSKAILEGVEHSSSWDGMPPYFGADCWPEPNHCVEENAVADRFSLLSGRHTPIPASTYSKGPLIVHPVQFVGQGTVNLERWLRDEAGRDHALHLAAIRSIVELRSNIITGERLLLEYATGAEFKKLHRHWVDCDEEGRPFPKLGLKWVRTPIRFAFSLTVEGVIVYALRTAAYAVDHVFARSWWDDVVGRSRQTADDERGGQSSEHLLDFVRSHHDVLESSTVEFGVEPGASGHYVLLEARADGSVGRHLGQIQQNGSRLTLRPITLGDLSAEQWELYVELKAVVESARAQNRQPDIFEVIADPTAMPRHFDPAHADSDRNIYGMARPDALPAIHRLEEELRQEGLLLTTGSGGGKRGIVLTRHRSAIFR